MLNYIAFGFMHTMYPISTRTGFWDDVKESVYHSTLSITLNQWNLACHDKLIEGIETSKKIEKDPWVHFPALESTLKERVD